MSAHKPTIRLTAQAERGIEDILLYTERTWGFDQSETYAMVITQARELLRDHPQFGRQHDGLVDGCRSIRINQHIMYYHLPQSDLIEIVRILHGRRDPTSDVSVSDS